MHADRHTYIHTYIHTHMNTHALLSRWNRRRFQLCGSGWKRVALCLETWKNVPQMSKMSRMRRRRCPADGARSWYLHTLQEEHDTRTPAVACLHLIRRRIKTIYLLRNKLFSSLRNRIAEACLLRNKMLSTPTSTFFRKMVHKPKGFCIHTVPCGKKFSTVGPTDEDEEALEPWTECVVVFVRFSDGRICGLKNLQGLESWWGKLFIPIGPSGNALILRAIHAWKSLCQCFKMQSCDR